MRRLVIDSVALTAILGALASSGSVVAAADSSRCTSDSACAGKATFAGYGDLFTVYDRKSDGKAAVVQYWLPDGSGPNHVWNSQGNGTAVKGDLELVEGAWITYRVCLGKQSTKTIYAATCSATTTDYS
jgi:hypothetical protein